MDPTTHEFVGDISTPLDGNIVCNICFETREKHTGQGHLFNLEANDAQDRGNIYLKEKTVEDMIEEMVQRFPVQRKQVK